MKGIVVTGAKLFLICAIAASVLGLVNAMTEPVIRERKIRELKEALESLVPQGEVGKLVKVENNDVVKGYYPVKKGGELFAYILDLRGNGYGGELKILAAFKGDGEIVNVKLMDTRRPRALARRRKNQSI